MSLKRMGQMLAAGCLAAAAMVILPGCEQKEKVIDIETPSGEIEVERDKNTGEVDVEVDGEKVDETK